MQYVLIDAVPCLLFGSSPIAAGSIPESAPGVLEAVFARYRTAIVADAEHTAAGLRRALENHGIDRYFESVTTSAGFGPAVSARVLRRLISASRIPPGQVVIVTGRARLAEELRRSRHTVILTEGPAGFAGIPAALEAIETGRITP